MEQPPTGRSSSRSSSYEKLVAIGLALVAVVSPLYIDRRADTDEEHFNWLSLLLLVLILAITLMLLSDWRLIRFDPYWIHRVGGSSVGIVVILVVLALLVKCKASMNI
ncbi:hypothetical protein HS088_TW09G01223 [Tripterygium wilfordii]|uniref:Transmembrane protein n=1 Tax=Tripterygium wilfordii TaxID=458696 RepID=A0A7J7DA75_TRIWF|nr:uncharacterized protein LOC120005156 [Tripterygium wilfordii]KAF5743158.1 hypothetical protein HS088_TW09G01223 [Tripterygium wilfordii]